MLSRTHVLEQYGLFDEEDEGSADDEVIKHSGDFPPPEGGIPTGDGITAPAASSEESSTETTRS